SAFYTPHIIAATNDSVAGTTTETLKTMSLASVNDSGQVAFLGQVSSGTNSFGGILRGSGRNAVADLSSALGNSSRIFGFPQINNAGDVVASDVFSNFFFIRKWNSSGF